MSGLFGMVSRALGSETAKLPFTWSDKPDVPERHAAWAQHPGKLKADGSPVTVFVFNKTKAPARVAFARNALRRARTLRHPDLVKLVEGIETETQIVIATEAVTPLARLDWHQLDPLLKCWGLYKMAHLLNFFHADCRLAHLNFSLETVQVTAAGEWKLTGLDLVMPGASDASAAAAPSASPPATGEADAELPNPFSVGMIDGVTEHRYPPEMANANWSAFAAHPLHAVDAWAFGCLVYELYIKQAPLQTRQEVLAATQGTRPASVHVSLYTAFRHLVRPEPKMRGTLDKFLKQTGGPNGFFDNHFVKTSLFLEHITLKSVAEKEAFASQLAEHVNEFPLAFTKYKILPELCQAVEYGGVGARGIPSVLRIGQRLDEDDVQKMLVPLIVRLFASTDRSIRVSLLSQLDEYHRYLDANTISDAIYPSLCTGFSDSNAIVREHTLRSILVIADKLNEKILNNTLLRFLAKLQTDPEPGIRTNTTILLGKLATKLRPQIAQSVLVPAFTRAFKDSFPPARIAGMAAIGVTHELYPLADICNRILPHVMPLLMDPEKPVRQQAFKILDIFVKRVRELSAALPDTAAPPPAAKVADGAAEGPAGAAAASTASGAAGAVASAAGTALASTTANWAGWALSAMSNTIIKSAISPSTSTANLNRLEQPQGGSPMIRPEALGPLQRESSPLPPSPATTATTVGSPRVSRAPPHGGVPAGPGGMTLSRTGSDSGLVRAAFLSGVSDPARAPVPATQPPPAAAAAAALAAAARRSAPSAVPAGMPGGLASVSADSDGWDVAENDWNWNAAQPAPRAANGRAAAAAPPVLQPPKAPQPAPMLTPASQPAAPPTAPGAPADDDWLEDW